MQWLDKSDCVGAWQNEKLAAVVFCTADCLTQLRNLDGVLIRFSICRTHALGSICSPGANQHLTMHFCLESRKAIKESRACPQQITPVIQTNVKIDFDLHDIVGGDLGDRLVLVFNPQWQTGGQILSDFG